jgi:hypothetical protein
VGRDRCGCFRRRYRQFDLNIGVVRGSDSLLVVDTRADLRQAVIRELHNAGVAVADALDEAGDRWPFPVEALAFAVRRGYEALGPAA